MLTQLIAKMVEDTWLRMRKRLSYSFPPHGNELCSLI